ncbi:MAG TPA: universal stress protein [Solirubrobacteraceae bacterium]|nr:universal stress protein [Solirubrobacteraceae bacterium]
MAADAAADDAGQEQGPSRSGELLKRSVGSPLLFTIVYSSLASAIYFTLGVVAGHALGLTPLVFLIAAGMYALTAMTYVEAASLHQERGGSTVFARYAFNELVSFAAGWAILLDYTILIAVTAFTATQYAGTFWAPLAEKGPALAIALAVIALVVLLNIRGFSPRRTLRVGALLAGDLALQALIVVVGLVLFLEPHKITSTIDLGTAPTWTGLLFAATITVVAFTSLESASGLAGEVRVGRAGLKRLVASTTATVAFLYVGIAIVAISALPVHDGTTALAERYRNAPMIGVVEQMHPHWLEQILLYTVAALATVTLVAAANSAMLGLSRLAYSLSTKRQIPTGLGRLHPRRSTPFVLIGIAGAAAALLVIPEDLELLIGAYAFGAMVAFTIAHLSVIRLRYKEPGRDRAYRVPLSVEFRGASLPLPAVFGALISFAGWIIVMVVHAPARYVGLGWMIVGIALYAVYRRVSGLPLLEEISVPASVLVRDQHASHEYGSVLVPLTGTQLDDDIMQTAALLAAGEQQDSAAIDSATIEALWISVIPMALPLDASLPADQLRRARGVLARAKAIGEEFSGIHVATAMVRTRRAGYAIVDEAKRRGVEAIVLAAEEPSRIRGGSMFGGLGGPRESSLGEVARYVIAKAECRVIVTAPAAEDAPVELARRGRQAETPIV